MQMVNKIAFDNAKTGTWNCETLWSSQEQPKKINPFLSVKCRVRIVPQRKHAPFIFNIFDGWEIMKLDNTSMEKSFQAQTDGSHGGVFKLRNYSCNSCNSGLSIAAFNRMYFSLNKWYAAISLVITCIVMIWLSLSNFDNFARNK